MGGADVSYEELREQVEAGETADLAVEEEYDIRRDILTERYDAKREDIDAYRKDKRLRGFDKKAQKRQYKNKAGLVGAGVGTPAGGLAAVQTMGVAGAFVAWPVVLGAAAAGGVGAGMVSYYGMGKLSDTALEGRNRYVEAKAGTKERFVDMRESVGKTVLDVKEKKDAGLEQVKSFLSRGGEEAVPDEPA